MSFLKNNVAWIAPTGAVFLSVIVLVATGFLERNVEVRSASQEPASDPLAGFSASAQLPNDAGVPNSDAVSSHEIADLIKRARMNSNEAEVTRNTPPDLLDTQSIAPAALAAPVVAPEPVAAPEPVLAAASEPAQSSADKMAFFANAQANLAADNPCGDDLKALVEETNIYFPSGGLTAETSGLIKARVIGTIAENCPNYTLQIRGHSDPSGDPAVNLALSKQRAETLKTMLMSSGVDTSSFVAVGMGDLEPSNVVGPESTAYYDRRVDFAVVESVKTASAGGFVQPWASTAATASTCANALAVKAEQTRLFYNARSITMSPSELTPVYELAQAVMDCEGTRLRVMGQHSDASIDREDTQTGRMRALVLMGSLVAAGFEEEKILVGALSYSAGVANQPALPRSRVDFQIILD